MRDNFEALQCHGQCSLVSVMQLLWKQGRTLGSEMDYSFIDTNLIHNFLYKLHKIKFLCMFRASSAYLQEVIDVNCTCTINIIDLLKMSG